ncbi:MAG TPA: MFS transporter [Bryobacteraceae bacterium]|nr:MFS transporter [Bryobacteraceae bacterium]
MSRTEIRLLILLILSIFINYIDRSNLSIAAPVLQQELSLSDQELGSLLAAFFWTYAFVQLFGIAGWLADRFPVGWVFAAGFFLWSAATALTGAVTGFSAIFAMRLIVGAGESLAYPCYSKIIASDFPQHHRGVANALLDAGSKLGPALGTLLGGMLLAPLGWRWFFVGLGVGSLLWLIPWLKYMPRDRAAEAVASHKGPHLAQILSKRSAWGAFIAHFCANYYWFFLLTWLPSYLVRERHYSLSGMAAINSTAFLLMAAATVTAGWWSDRRISKGVSPTIARKTMVAGGLLLSTIILPVAVVQDETLSMGLLLIACMGFGVYTSNHWAITQTLAGPLAAGRWTSVQNGIGNLSGIAAPWLTGKVVQQTGSFYLAFVVSAAIVLISAFCWTFVVGKVEEVPWQERSA